MAIDYNDESTVLMVLVYLLIDNPELAPKVESYLEARYGEEQRAYAAKMRGLIWEVIANWPLRD